MNKLLILVSIGIGAALPACAVSPAATPTIPSPITSPSPARTRTPTSAPSPSTTPLPPPPTVSPTITATPGPTPLAGGSGALIGACAFQVPGRSGWYSDEIRLLDLAHNVYSDPFTDLPHSPDRYETASLTGISGDGSWVAWDLMALLESGWSRQGGFVSDASFIERYLDLSQWPHLTEVSPWLLEWSEPDQFNWQYLLRISLSDGPGLREVVTFPPEDHVSVEGEWESPRHDYLAIALYPEDFLSQHSLLILDRQNAAAIDAQLTWSWGDIPANLAWHPTRAIFAISAVDPSTYTPTILIYDVLTMSVSTAFVGESPSWSPDGARLAFVRDNEIVVSDAQGIEEFTLSDEARWGFTTPAWSRDGLRLAYTAILQKCCPQANDIRVFDLATNHATTLGTFEYGTGIGPGEGITWSPDSAWFLLRAWRPMSPGWVIEWYYCNPAACRAFSPPGADEGCGSVSWLGPAQPWPFSH